MNKQFLTKQEKDILAGAVVKIVSTSEHGKFKIEILWNEAAKLKTQWKKRAIDRDIKRLKFYKELI